MNKQYGFWGSLGVVSTLTITGAYAFSDRASVSVSVNVPVICKTDQSATATGKNSARVTLNSFCNTNHSLKVLPLGKNGQILKAARYSFDGVQIDQDSNGYITLRENSGPIKQLSYLDVSNIPAGQTVSFQVETNAY